MFCGVSQEVGRDGICAQAGELLANLKQGSICIVDANVTSPSLHAYFGVENDPRIIGRDSRIGPVMGFTQQVGRGRLRL